MNSECSRRLSSSSFAEKQKLDSAIKLLMQCHFICSSYLQTQWQRLSNHHRRQSMSRVFTVVGFVALTFGSVAHAQDMATLSKVRQLCMADVKKYCSKQTGSPEQVLACLQKNKKNVKPACAEVVSKLPAAPAAAKTK
jgi:hypothetical protein